MKKMILSFIALLGASVIMHAAAPVAKATTNKAVTAARMTKSPATVKTNAAPATGLKTATITPVKKDGTPDKRFRANKAKTAGQLKKDGTPDKRFKANKP